jgi:hypothetical protein
MPCIRHSKNKRTKAINIREMLKWGDLHASAHANGVPCECTTEAAAFTAESSKDWRGARKELHLKSISFVEHT